MHAASQLPVEGSSLKWMMLLHPHVNLNADDDDNDDDCNIKQELSHDSIARLNCALPITKTISVIW